MTQRGEKMNPCETCTVYLGGRVSKESCTGCAEKTDT